MELLHKSGVLGSWSVHFGSSRLEKSRQNNSIERVCTIGLEILNLMSYDTLQVAYHAYRDVLCGGADGGGISSRLIFEEIGIWIAPCVF